MAPTKPSKFSYVFIPADLTHAIEAREFDQVSLEDDQFIKMIKKYFAMANPESGVDKEMLIKQLSERTKNEITTSLDPETLDHLLSSTSVDILSIAVPSKENEYFGVSLYCDDKGKAKKLPLNDRASGLAASCALVGQFFHGDVFLSRMYDDGEEHWFRTDFTMDDVSSVAAWVKRSADRAARKLSSGPTSLSGLAERFLANSGQSPALMTPDEVDARDHVKGKTEKYRWYQSPEEVEITIPVTESVTKAQIEVDIKAKSVRVVVGTEMVVEGNLADGIDTGDSTWTFSTKDRLLQVTLVKKTSGKMWETVFRQ